MPASFNNSTALVGLALALLTGCASSKPSQDTSHLLTPTKEILVFETDSSRPYEPIGPVDFTLPHGVAYGSTLDAPPEAKREVKDWLKKVAFTKYGDSVDAIVSVTFSKQVKGGIIGTVGAGFGAKNTEVSAEGIAVRFK